MGWQPQSSLCSLFLSRLRYLSVSASPLPHFNRVRRLVLSYVITSSWTSDSQLALPLSCSSTAWYLSSSLIAPAWASLPPTLCSPLAPSSHCPRVISLSTGSLLAPWLCRWFLQLLMKGWLCVFLGHDCSSSWQALLPGSPWSALILFGTSIPSLSAPQADLLLSPPGNSRVSVGSSQLNQMEFPSWTDDDIAF